MDAPAPDYDAWTATWTAPSGTQHQIVLVRDLEVQSAQMNSLVLQQWTQEILVVEGYFRSATTLLRELDKRFYTVKDAPLIRRLKELDAVGNKAYAIRLVAPAALADACRALTKNAALASSISDLATQPCPLMALAGRGMHSPAFPALPTAAAVDAAAAGPSTTTADAGAAGALAPLPSRVAVGQQSAGTRLLPGPYGPYYYATHMRFPIVLSPIKWTPEDIKARYGVTAEQVLKMPASTPLRHEIPIFVAWCKDPVRLDRGLHKALKQSTVDTAMSTIHKLLGFSSKYKAVPTSALSLRLFSHQVLLWEYICFVYARSSVWTVMSKEISQCKRVVLYLVAADGFECKEKREHLLSMVTWLEIAARQFYQLISPPKALPQSGEGADAAPGPAGRLDADEGEAMEGLPSGEALVTWVISQLARDALAPLLDPQCEGLTYGQAIHLMYLALTEMLGGNIPPVRIYCLRMLQGPPSVTGVPFSCADPDCQDPACLGNRLELVHGQCYHMDPSSAPADAPPRRLSLGLGVPPELTPQQLTVMRLVLPHHKTERMFGYGAVEVELPCHLACMLHLHLTYARPVLMSYHAVSHGYVFMNPKAGDAPMADATLSKAWKDIQKQNGAPWQHFPPGQFRHIHIGFLVQRLADAVAASGLDFRGDAAAMGNTVGPVWERHYMKGCGYYNTMIPASVDNMVKWRQGVVRRLLAAEPPPRAEGGAATPAAPPAPREAVAPRPAPAGMALADLWREVAAAGRQALRQAAEAALAQRAAGSGGASEGQQPMPRRASCDGDGEPSAPLREGVSASPGAGAPPPRVELQEEAGSESLSEMAISDDECSYASCAEDWQR